MTMSEAAEQRTVDFSVFNIEYTLENGDPVLHMLCRSKLNPKHREHLKVRGFIPYFYLAGDSITLANEMVRRVYRDPSHLLSITGDPVTKIETYVPAQVSELRKKVLIGNQTYQSNVLFPKNFLATTGIKSSFTVSNELLTRPASVNPQSIVPDYDIRDYNNLMPIDDLGVEPLTITIDIEVNNEMGGLPDATKGTMPIIMITTIDSYTNKLYTFAWHPKRKEHAKPDEVVDSVYHFTKSNKDIPWKLFLFDNEIDMFYKFKQYYENVKPDIITGWNVDFDVGYIIGRLFYLQQQKISHISPSFLSPIQRAFVSKRGDPIVGAVSVLDMLFCYKAITKFLGMKDSYKLDDVGYDELKLKKMPHLGSVGQFWRSNFKQSIYYNVRDVEICWELNKKLNIIKFFDIQRRQVGCTFDDSTATSRIIEMDQLRAAMKMGKVLPTNEKSLNPDDEDDLEGAYVFEPEVGIFENIISFDLKSLYPSIIITLNISPETRIDPNLYSQDELLNFIHSAAGHYYRKDVVGFAKDRLIEFNKQRDNFKTCKKLVSLIQKAIKKIDATAMSASAIKEVAYRTMNESLTGKKPMQQTVVDMVKAKFDMINFDSSTVDDLITIVDSEKTTYDLMQMAEKAKINTWYGVMGHEGASLYNIQDAESVTLSGQVIIKYTAELVASDELKQLLMEKFDVDVNLKVLYGDTDSIMIKGLEAITDGKLICEIADYISQFMTTKYDRFCVDTFNTDQGNHALKIRSEKIDKRFLMAPKKDQEEGGKKRYARLPWYELSGEDEWLEYKETEIQVTGFESKRSNVSRIGRDTQKKVMEFMLWGKSKAIIRQYVLKVKDAFLSGKIDIDKIAFNVSLTDDISEYSAVKEKKPRTSWPPHVRAAQWGIENLHQNWQSGDKVKWIYVAKSPARLPPTDVLAIDSPDSLKGFTLDYESLYKKQIKENLVSILKAAGWSYDDVIQGASMSTL